MCLSFSHHIFDVIHSVLKNHELRTLLIGAVHEASALVLCANMLNRAKLLVESICNAFMTLVVNMGEIQNINSVLHGQIVDSLAVPCSSLPRSCICVTH